MAKTEAELRESFVNDPTSMEAFSALRRTFQGEERWEDLAWLYIERAKAPLEDNRRADMYFKAAELYLDQLGKNAEGISALYEGVLLDPKHRRNSRRLKDLLKETGDNTRYLGVLEQELKLLEEQGTDKRGIGQLHFECAELFASFGGRNIDALKHYREAFRYDNQNIDALNRAADILVSEKMFEEALPLLEYQMKSLRDPSDRAKKLEIIGRIKLEHIRDVQAAEAALKEAISLAPEHISYLYTLGEIYSDRRYPQEEGLLKNARVFLNIARMHMNAGEQEKAVSALKQSISMDPVLDESFSLLATIYEQNGEFELLSELLDRGGNSFEGQTKVRLMLKRATIMETHLADPAGARSIYFELLETAPESVIPNLVLNLQKEENWVELARLREKELQIYTDVPKIVQTRLELIRLYRDHLNRPDRSAAQIHEILKVDPENLEALDLYIDHFREKGDRRSQVDTMEFALEAARKQRASREYLVNLLKEMADIYHRHLGDLHKTERCLSLLTKAEPDNPRYQQALAKTVQKREMWEGYKADLMADIQNAATDADKLYGMKNLASALMERKLDVSMNIKLYQEILAMDPDDEDAFYGLEELFNREGDMESLYRMYEMKMQGATPEQAEEILSSMFDIARNKLMDPMRVGKTAAKLLEIDPSHEEALKALIESLEALENWPKLAAVLERFANSLYDREEKCTYLLKSAEVYKKRLGNLNETARLLQTVVNEGGFLKETVPQLLEIYDKNNQYAEYAQLLESAIAGDWLELNVQQESEFWKKLGTIYERRLENLEKSLECWTRLLDSAPEDSDALIAVARISYFLERWDSLAETMEKQIALSESPDQKLNLLSKLADIYLNKLSQPDDALRIIEQIPEDQRNEDLERQQAELYRMLSEPEKALKLYEKWLNQCTNIPDKVELLVNISEMYLNDIRDPVKAGETLDNALLIDPSNYEVLMLQKRLCEDEGRYERLAQILEKLLEVESDESLTVDLLEKLGDLYAVNLEKPLPAFTDYFEAYKRAPHLEEISEKAEKIAKEHQLYPELIKFYNYMIGRSRDPYVEKEYISRLIEVIEVKQKDAQTAMDTLSRYVMKYHDDEELLVEAERIARSFEGGLASLLSLYEHIINNMQDRIRKAALLIKAAVMCEKEMNDAKSALRRYERAFRAHPFAEGIISQVERLSRALGEWELFNAIQIPQLSGMLDPLEKVDHLVKIGTIMEKEANAPVKAFRVYLHAFLMEPGNDKITDNLWRLAESINKYDEKERLEQPLKGDSLVMSGVRDYLRGEDRFMEMVSKPQVRKPEVTQEVDFEDFEELEPSFNEYEPEDDDYFAKAEMTGPTHSLTMQDLLEARKEESGSFREIEPSQLIEEYDGDVSNTEVRKAAAELGTVIGGSSEQLAPPLTPWEEMARAYAMLPHAEISTRVEHLKEIARIWIEGAKDYVRGFNVLGRAFTLACGDKEIREGLYTVATGNGMIDKLAMLYMKVGSESPTSVATELYDIAATYFHVAGLPIEEENALRAILAIEPSNEKAYNDLVSKMKLENAWQDLVALMDWHFEQFRDSMPFEELHAFYLEMARLTEEKTENYESAMIFRLKYLENEPDHVESLRKVIELGRRMKAWGRTSEALRKLSDITDSDEERMELLMELAGISEGELELPDQAINVYREIIAIDSKNMKALNALDKLYTSHELWEDLENILIKLSAMELPPEISKDVKDRLCNVLEKLDREDEAAVIYNELWEQTGETRYAVRASNMYMEMGEPSRGVEILSNLLQAENTDYSAEEKASMWTNLALIQKRSLNDLVNARRSLENALGLSPYHVETLELLAEIQRDTLEWEKYVDTQELLARVYTDADDRISALYIAGKTSLDELGDLERSEKFFRNILSLLPSHSEAISSLQNIYEMGKRFDKVFEILGMKINYVKDAPEHARLLSSQAYIALNHFNDTELAYNLLTEALGLDQSSVEAILTLADLSQAREEWAQAAELLENALKKTKDEPDKVARLGRRYAQLMDMQGKGENAVTLLQELDRKYPDELLIKLTLGEIRFKSGRWRETVKILSGIQDHPSVAQYPEEVAAALCMAAESEMKQRKGFLPRELWEAAVKIKSDYLPAIESLIEFHLSRGEEVEAATYLKAQADVATSPESRSKLFKSLGDLYSKKLKKPSQALDCYLECYNLLDYITEDELELIKTIALVASETGRLIEVYEILKDLISLTPENEKLNYIIMAGEVALAKGLVSEASTWLEDAQRRAPAHEKVLLALSELYEKDEKLEKAMVSIETLLDRKTGIMAENERRNNLKGRLGKIYYRLGMDDKAAKALEECLAGALVNKSVTGYIETLVEILSKNAMNFEKLDMYRRKLLAIDALRPALIKDMADGAKTAGRNDLRMIYLQLLDVMQALTDEEDAAFYNENLAEYKKLELNFDGRLDQEDRDALALGTDIHSMSNIFEALWEAAPAIFGTDLTSLGLSSSDKISPVDKSSLAVIYSEVSKVLGDRKTGLYFGRTRYSGVTVACHAPPMIVIGEDTVNNPAATLRFLLSRSIMLANPKFIMAAGFYPEEFSKFISSLMRAFHPRYSRRQFKTLDPIDEKAQNLKNQVPYRVSKTIIDMLTEKGDQEFNSGYWRRNVWMVGNRTGLLLCGDLREVLRILIFEESGDVTNGTVTVDKLKEYMEKIPAVKDIITFQISDTLIQMRNKLKPAT